MTYEYFRHALFCCEKFFNYKFLKTGAHFHGFRASNLFINNVFKNIRNIIIHHVCTDMHVAYKVLAHAWQVAKCLPQELGHKQDYGKLFSTLTLYVHLWIRFCIVVATIIAIVVGL